MCEKGLNTEQLRMMIGQADNSLAISQQWLEQLHHLADHASIHDASTYLAQATVLLGETRAKLEEALDSVEGNSGSSVDIRRY